LSVPSGPDRGPIAVGGLSLTIGAFQWLVPAFALSVPGLLLILVVLAQLVGGGLFLPVSRRALAGDGVAHRRGRRD
jgi:hypothetical protein